MNKPIDISDVTLKTGRLVLRPFVTEDLEDFYEYASVEGVGECAGWTHHKSIEDSRKILQMFLESKKTFAVTLDGKTIGSIGVECYSEKDLPEFAEKQGRELGFVLSKAYWGRGIMTEAVKAVIHWLFEEEKLDFIVCGHFMGNERSRRVQDKCGFVPYKQNLWETQWGELKENVISLLKREAFE